MSVLSLLFTQIDQKGTKFESSIGQIFLDVTVSESPEMTNRITKNPIEDGSSIADHVIQDPDVLTLEGIVTDDPIRFLSGIRDLAERGLGSLTRSQSAFELIEKLKKEATVITVITGLKTYENMIISRFNPRRDNTTGFSLRFTLVLEQIEIKKSQTVSIPRDTVKDAPTGTGDQSASTVDGGKQPPLSPDDTTVEGTSVLKAILTGAGRLLTGQ